MLLETDLVAEGLVAHVAAERPLAVVRAPRVHLEAVRRREDLGALHARVDAATAAAAVGPGTGWTGKRRGPGPPRTVYTVARPPTFVWGLPDMMSASEGGGGHGKADIVREVECIL